MNPEQLKAYKREKSRLFNANLRELRLKDKANQLFQKVEPKVEPNKRQDDNQDNLQDNLQDDVLSLEDLMDIYETLDTKLDLIESKLKTKLDIIETKLDKLDKLETNQPIKQPPSIFFA